LADTGPEPPGHQIPLHDVDRPLGVMQLHRNAQLPGPQPTDLSFAYLYCPGDLIYGLAKYRKYYFHQLLPSGWLTQEDGVTPSGCWTYADCYNHKIFCQSVETRGDRWRRRRDRPRAVAPDGPNQLSRFQEFLANDSRYSSQRKTEERQVDLFGRILRSCKGNILYTTIQRHHAVHFILDGLNMERIIADTAVEHSDRDATGIELRKVYRMWGNDEVRSRVIFWHEDNQVRPPWQQPQHGSTWASYVPRRFREA